MLFGRPRRVSAFPFCFLSLFSFFPPPPPPLLSRTLRSLGVWNELHTGRQGGKHEGRVEKGTRWRMEIHDPSVSPSQRRLSGSGEGAKIEKEGEGGRGKLNWKDGREGWTHWADDGPPAPSKPHRQGNPQSGLHATLLEGVGCISPPEAGEETFGR